jgi:hypothetical protein
MSRPQKTTNYLVKKRFHKIIIIICYMGNFTILLENNHIPSHHLNVQKNCVRICSMYFSEFTVSHNSCCIDSNSHGIEWHHTYWTNCWPLSITLNTSMTAYVKWHLVRQVTWQCFDFIIEQCTKQYSQNSLLPGGFAQLYIWMVLIIQFCGSMYITWTHPFPGISNWKYFVEMIKVSFTHPLMFPSQIHY